MTRLRLKHLIGGSLAMIAMLVASVSACACQHHGKKVVKTVPSCHAAAHHAVETDPTVSDNDRLGANCDCPVRTQVAAVLGKPGGKKAKLLSDSPDIAQAAQTSVSQVSGFRPAPDAAFTQDLTPYISPASRYAPSRAPPRL